MIKSFDKNWTTTNDNLPLNDSETERYISVRPNENQLRLAQKPFYCFIHFGMNTATGREWGAGVETVKDFTITKIDTAQWVRVIKSSGATGIILTCKHHDGFCLWDTQYTDFCVKNTEFKKDIVKLLSDECAKQGLDFGIYLSPWDMHDKRYGTKEYDDYFCNQLTELLTNYGKIFEVWFDGAKGSNAVKFEYDWDRYHELIRTLQPQANIAICGPDIRWVGNEGGHIRQSEYSVVPSALRDVEKIMKNSKQNEKQTMSVQKYFSSDEDLGSRKVLKKNAYLCWYPAEADVSIRKGWFYSKDENMTVKSVKKLFNLYLDTVGSNCTLLFNVPPTDKGIIHRKDARVLKKLGAMIDSIELNPVLVQSLGELTKDNGYIDFNFNDEKELNYIVISEDISFSQRVESFEIFLKNKNGKLKREYKGTVIGAKKIIRLNSKKCVGARFIIRSSRSTPIIKSIGFYE
ncbi:MAG: alpha-L-fucosidase [Clostridiales bacterium]|nr:alpha-L-fucosidase [Clostridiales bacterium]